LFIETVDPQEIVPPHGQIARQDPGLSRMANRVVEDGLPMGNRQPSVFCPERPAEIICVFHGVFGHPLGHHLVQTNTVARPCPMRAPHPHMSG